MLNITKTVEYGLIAMRHINKHGNNKSKLFSSKEIAATYHIPQEILAKTMQKLSKKQYIAAVKGPYGGYYLNKSLEKINLIEFIEDIEGPVGLVQCNTNSNCDLLEFCNIKAPLMKINSNLRRVLNKINLNDLTN